MKTFVWIVRAYKRIFPDASENCNFFLLLFFCLVIPIWNNFRCSWKKKNNFFFFLPFIFPLCNKQVVFIEWIEYCRTYCIGNGWSKCKEKKSNTETCRSHLSDKISGYFSFEIFKCLQKWWKHPFRFNCHKLHSNVDCSANDIKIVWVQTISLLVIKYRLRTLAHSDYSLSVCLYECAFDMKKLIFEMSRYLSELSSSTKCT